MSWASDAISSRLDDARRRMAELQSEAHDAIDKVKETASSAATTVSDAAASAVAFGEQHASDVVAAAKNAGESALDAAKHTANASNVRAQFGIPNVNPGGYHAAKQAQKQQQAPAQAQAPQEQSPEEKPLIGPVPIDRWSDDFLHHTITAQRRKVNDTPEGPARDEAKMTLGALETEAHKRTLAREYEDRPDDELPPEKAAWIRNPTGHEWAAAATGFVAGMAATAGGPLGMAGLVILDGAVEKYASPEDRRAYGTGETLAGEADLAVGVAGMGVGGTIEIGTGGAGSAVGIPVAGVGAYAAAAGTVLMARGQALHAKGSPSTSTTSARPAAPAEAKNKVPTSIDDNHIFEGEFSKFDSNGKPIQAAGCHHKPIGSENRIRVKEGTRPSTPDKHGVYMAEIEIKFKNADGTISWVPKKEPTSLFPDAWDKTRIRKEIREAYATTQVDANGRWIGKSSSGVTIEGFVDRTTRNNIDSAWPIYEP